MNVETIDQIKEDVGELKLNVTKLDTMMSNQFKHLTYRIDAISSVRMWIITIGAVVGGVAGLIKIVEKFTG